MINLKNNYINIQELVDELEFKTSRSSGKGGQHVNKVSTKVMLIFDLKKSVVLKRNQKELIFSAIPNKINKIGVIQLSSSESRSQLKNKNIVIDRFIGLINKCLEPVEPRIETKPTKSSIRKRKISKVERSMKKINRKKVDIEE
jgi:ribosome-associated protein